MIYFYAEYDIVTLGRVRITLCLLKGGECRLSELRVGHNDSVNFRYVKGRYEIYSYNADFERPVLEFANSPMMHEIMISECGALWRKAEYAQKLLLKKVEGVPR